MLLWRLEDGGLVPFPSLRDETAFVRTAHRHGPYSLRGLTVNEADGGLTKGIGALAGKQFGIDEGQVAIGLFEQPLLNKMRRKENSVCQFCAKRP